MRPIRGLRTFLLRLGLISLLAGTACTIVPSPRPSRAAAAPDTLTATCHAVDLKARTLAVVTGVGFALREERFRVDPGCEIRVRGASAQLPDLKPGEIVRIRYRRQADGNVAESIECLHAAEPGSAR